VPGGYARMQPFPTVVAVGRLVASVRSSMHSGVLPRAEMAVGKRAHTALSSGAVRALLSASASPACAGEYPACPADVLGAARPRLRAGPVLRSPVLSHVLVQQRTERLT